MKNLYLNQSVYICVKFFKFKKDKPKYKTTEMLEEFRGEDGEGMNLVDDGKFSEAVDYFDKMLEKYPRSVYFRAHKAFALYALKRYDEAVTYFDEIEQIVDFWRNKYLPTFQDLSVITCSSLLTKARVMELLNRQDEMSLCYNKIIEISEFLLTLDKEYYRKHYYLLSPEARMNYHPKGYYYDVLPYRARVRIRKGEIQDLLKELSEFLTGCTQDFLNTAKDHLQNELKKETRFDGIKKNPQLQKLLKK